MGSFAASCRIVALSGGCHAFGVAISADFSLSLLSVSVGEQATNRHKDVQIKPRIVLPPFPGRLAMPLRQSTYCAAAGQHDPVEGIRTLSSGNIPLSKR